MANRTLTTKRFKALTLMEMVIAMSIMVVVFAAVLPQFRLIDLSWDIRQASADTIQNGRVLVDHLNRNLAKAVKITAVSGDSDTNGYIEFESTDGVTYRCDLAANNYIEYGPVGSQSELAGPVSSLKFICYGLDDLDTPIITVESIRLVKAEAVFTNAAAQGQDKVFIASGFLRTEGAVGKIFETDAIEAVSAKNMDNTQIATKTVLSESGTITSLLAYVKGPPLKKLRFAVYSDNSGEPGDLIVESDIDSIKSNSLYWHEIAVLPTHLDAGTYWLVLAFEFKNQYYNHSSSGQGQIRYKNNDAIANGFVPQWLSSDVSGTERVSIYATYTPD